jgi:uncharacterized protein YfaS (alpha-2-macroglobulin family)
MKKTILKVVGFSLALIIIGLAIKITWPYLGFSPSSLSAAVTQSRLVPEKVSQSATISVALPKVLKVNTTEQVVFNPSIHGRWLKKENGELISIIDTQSKTEIYYYQPASALEIGRHYAAVVNLGSNQTLSEDFLTVPDPEILSILPTDEEVLPQTKISIAFNRPMVPLSRLDQFIDDSLPVTITPPTSGRFKWISTNTLQFIPENGLISSTEYLVTVNSGFKSMDGLAVKPKEARFSTYHLDYDAPAKESLKPSIVRGYNQPFLIRFNQPVDLEKTKSQIVINSDGENIPFSLAYDEAPNDFQTLALTPVGKDGRWEINKNYVVTVNQAFPKSGGNIILDKKQSFTYQVGGLVRSSRVTSPQTQTTSLDRFDPKGTLIIDFYEDIDLDKSQISGKDISNIVYGEKCAEESRRNCSKVPNQKEIIISFKPGIKQGEQIQISLDNIISSQRTTVGEEKNAVSLTTYGPLAVYRVGSGDSLESFTICSNNPLVGPKDEAGGSEIQTTPLFSITNFSGSYLVGSSNRLSVCRASEYSTPVYGYLVANQKYDITAKITDVFGSQTNVNTSFETRTVRAEDYQITSHQDYEVTTVPSRTKLTFSAKHLPEVLVTVCKLRPNDFYRAKKSSQTANLNYDVTCEAKASRVISLIDNNPEGRFLTVDIKDYFPLVIGNYSVTVSTTIPVKLEKWQSEAQVFVSVTNLIVTEKKIDPLDKNNYRSSKLTGSQLSRLKNLYWVLDATTREPVAGATISLYRQGSVLDTATTDNQGIASLSPVAGADMTVATFGQDAVVISGNSSTLSWASQAANIKHFYLYTDKPIYRPGQEVNLKGYYRLGYDGYYEVPVGQVITLKVYDSADKVIKEKNLETNKFGAVTTSINLNSATPLGSYRACVDYQCANFEVLNYAPAAFRVALESNGDEFTSTNQPKINLKADYYFGVPVNGASVDYYLSSQYYYFDKYTEEYFNFNNLFTEEQKDSDSYYYGDRYFSQGKAVLDENGETVIETEIKNADQSKIIILDTTVKNQTGRSISAQKSYILHAAPNYLGSKVEPSFVASGAPVSLQVKSVDTSGTPVSLGGIEAQVYRVRWTADKRSSDYITWKRTRELVKTESLRTDEKGDGTISLVVIGEGEYEVDVKTKNSQAVGSRSWFYLYGGGSVSVRSQDDTSLKIKTEKSELQSGEMGRVVMEIPEGRAKALITIEREQVFTYKVIEIVGNLASYEFPVTPEYYPNIRLSVVAYAPNRAVRFGYADFRVASNQKQLKINLSTNKKVYNPGDLVSLALTATDDAGRPAVAEVSLAVVDMSVLALRGNPKKDPVKEFYGHIPLTVATYSNFRNLLKYTEPGGEGKGGSGGDPNSSKKRGVFKEVAFWVPSLVTDSTGRANVTFKLPDNLTTWQVEAIGITFDTKVGASYYEFTTKKLLMVTPLKPRFVLPGDQFSLGAQVFNQSSKTLDLNVALIAPKLEGENQKNKNLSLKPGESGTVYWETKIPDTQTPGNVGYSISATGGGLADGVDDNLVINANTLYEVSATAGETENRITELVYVPDSILPDQGELTINSSATLAVYLPDALKYFLDYPYEGTEQKSRRLGALALISKIIAVPNLSTQNWPELELIIIKNLDSLYSLQNNDGGFRMWPESRESNYRSTVEAVNAFVTLSQASYQVNETAWSGATKYLANLYLKPNIQYGDAEVLAFLQVLFTQDVYRSNAQFIRDLDRVANTLTNDKKTPSNLLLTISEILHQYQLLPDQVKKVDLMLKNRLVIDSRGTFLDGDNAIGNTARYISILVIKQDKSQITDMLRWLIASRDKDGAWGSTKNTLVGVKAITDYLTWQPETSASFALENRINDKVAMEFTFEPKNILTQLKKVLPLGELRFGDLNTVSIGKKTPTELGKVYYDLAFKYFIPAEEATSRDEGLVIKRDFFARDDEKNENPISRAKVGEVIREHLEITVPVTRRDVAIQDFIPAGLEIVNTSLATEDQTLNSDERPVKNSKFWPNHREWRDDHAFLYRELLEPGTYEFDYLVRALVPGNYLRLPAQIWEMNNPENFGRSNTSRFIVE